MISDGIHLFCKPCRKHSLMCPCWQHGRFGVDCGVIGFPHLHENVDINFISTAERLAEGMLVRKKSSSVNEAIQNTGDLNALMVWCVQQPDFATMVIGKDMSVKIKTAQGDSLDLASQDWIRVNDTGKLDRIAASTFEASWEVV